MMIYINQALAVLPILVIFVFDLSVNNETVVKDKLKQGSYMCVY